MLFRSVALDFSTCAFAGATFENCCFIQASALGKDLADVTFVACNLYQSDFSQAKIRQAERCIFAECKLGEADFQQAALAGALFSKVDASGARFDGATLSGAMFPESTLTDASFTGAFAPGSVWTQADFGDANLERMSAPKSVFRNALFAGAKVDGADLTEADLHGVEETLDGADLRDARGTVDWRAEREAEARADANE